VAATVSGVLRRFLPGFLGRDPPLTPAARRAIWAIRHCRTAAMGAAVYTCRDCGERHFAFHSCNHKACPLCGRDATARWVERELGKLVTAPHFLVTFTLPDEARGLFFGAQAKDAYDLLFEAASGSLAEKLAAARGLHAEVSGFTAVLHTWNQRLLFHPHVHVIVPGAGIDSRGAVVTVADANFLLPIPLLRAAFRQHFRRALQARGWQIDPAAWAKDWGVDIHPFGAGSAAVKYLGAYVARTAISDGRIVACDDTRVSFTWKDRADHGRTKMLTLSGVEFVRRYLRHVLPRGLRSIRHYGFRHPTAKRNRERIRLHTARSSLLQGEPQRAQPPRTGPRCPHCNRPMDKIGRLLPPRTLRPSPRAPPPHALGA